MEKKYTIVGIDEAGRGPLAGPVVAASVVIEEKYLPKEINDSKKVSEKNRNLFYEIIIKDPDLTDEIINLRQYLSKFAKNNNLSDTIGRGLEIIEKT